MLPTPEYRGQQAYQAVIAAGGKVMPAIEAQIATAFDHYSVHWGLKRRVRLVLLNPSNQYARQRYGRLLADIESAGLGVYAASALLDRTYRYHLNWLALRRASPHFRPPVSMEALKELRLILRLMRRFEPDAFPGFVEIMTTPWYLPAYAEAAE